MQHFSLSLNDPLTFLLKSDLVLLSLAAIILLNFCFPSLNEHAIFSKIWVSFNSFNSSVCFSFKISFCSGNLEYIYSTTTINGFSTLTQLKEDWRCQSNKFPKPFFLACSQRLPLTHQSRTSNFWYKCWNTWKRSTLSLCVDTTAPNGHLSRLFENY